MVFWILRCPGHAWNALLVLIGALIIVVGAFVLAAIKGFVDSLPLAVALKILPLAVAVGIFVWLR